MNCIVLCNVFQEIPISKGIVLSCKFKDKPFVIKPGFKIDIKGILVEIKNVTMSNFGFINIEINDINLKKLKNINIRSLLDEKLLVIEF